jgi:hypothetical protein
MRRLTFLRDIVHTVRQVINVVSKYAGGALPEPAKNCVWALFWDFRIGGRVKLVLQQLLRRRLSEKGGSRVLVGAVAVAAPGTRAAARR